MLAWKAIDALLYQFGKGGITKYGKVKTINPTNSRPIPHTFWEDPRESNRKCPSLICLSTERVEKIKHHLKAAVMIWIRKKINVAYTSAMKIATWHFSF